MKKSRKLILSRETLHSLDLRNVAGGASLAVCGTLAGTTVDTNKSNTTSGDSMYTCNTMGVCSNLCESGGACTL